MITDQQKKLLNDYKEKAFISALLSEESYNYYNFCIFNGHIIIIQAIC